MLKKQDMSKIVKSQVLIFGKNAKNDFLFFQIAQLDQNLMFLQNFKIDIKYHICNYNMSLILELFDKVKEFWRRSKKKHYLRPTLYNMLKNSE